MMSLHIYCNISDPHESNLIQMLMRAQAMITCRRTEMTGGGGKVRNVTEAALPLHVG
jgi:hypothetical protein